MRGLFLAIFFSLFFQKTHAIECKHQIIFLPQTHAPDIKLFKKSRTNFDRNEVISSQYSIAKYIDENSQIPVFSEGASAAKNLIWKDLTEKQKVEIRDFARQVLPNGLPDSIHTANESEKSIFYKVDAASLEFIKEKIPAVYRVISPEDYEKVFGEIKKWLQRNPGKPWTPEIKKFVHDQRERLALAEIRKFFYDHPEQRDIILIFGSNHNFSIYPDLFDPSCVVVPYQFQALWIGKFRGSYETTVPTTNFYSHKPIE